MVFVESGSPGIVGCASVSTRISGRYQSPASARSDSRTDGKNIRESEGAIGTQIVAVGKIARSESLGPLAFRMTKVTESPTAKRAGWDRFSKGQ